MLHTVGEEFERIADSIKVPSQEIKNDHSKAIRFFKIW
jgi:hypothetical protein